MPENPLAALGPIAWESLDCSALDSFLAETFACAQLIADSVPSPTSASLSASASLAPPAPTTTGRPRSHTDGAVSYNPARLWGGNRSSTTTTTTSKDDGLPAPRDKKLAELRQSWKEVRTGGANPRDIVVYKMNGGREGYAGSSWFARRSLHRRTAECAPTSAAAGGSASAVVIDFDTFRRGLLHEFDLEAQQTSAPKKPTPVRTMVTKRRVEHVVHNGGNSNVNVNVNNGTGTAGELSIYLLEADFPGPTASRDFVTMLLTTESLLATTTGRHGGGRPCRQFMLVSKPCHHPETPARPGFVRAQYESVEMIREVPVPRAGAGSGVEDGRRTRSSIDLGHEQQQLDGGVVDHEMAIEWIMITRNNPGGSVPRFLVDKSTPGSIVNDANKFLDWLATRVWALRGSADVADTDPDNAAPGTAMSMVGLGAVIHEEEEEEARRAGAAARAS